MSYYGGNKHRPITPKRSLFAHDAKNEEASRMVKMDTPTHAEGSISWLNKEWEDATTHDRQVKLVEYANEASGRARVISENERVSPGQRDQARKVHRIYRRWVERREGKEIPARA